MTTDAFKPCEGKRAEQRALILSALQRGALSTIEARERLGVQSPAARVLELRRAGYRIETRRSRSHDAAGRPHTVAAYLLAGAAA